MIHWNWTTSTGVLERPYCQMEIRHAIKLRKPIVLLHGEAELRAHGVTHNRLTSCLLSAVPAESDARYGSFDFRAAHATAPADLQVSELSGL